MSRPARLPGQGRKLRRRVVGSPEEAATGFTFLRDQPEQAPRDDL